jgi:protein transport protein DSL1/ZW10
MASAKALQADIEASRRLASEIVRNSEADDTKIEAIQDQEAHVEFLEKESAFNELLRSALMSIKRINSIVDTAEEYSVQRQIAQPLQLLEGMPFPSRIPQYCLK